MLENNLQYKKANALGLPWERGDGETSYGALWQVNK